MDGLLASCDPKTEIKGLKGIGFLICGSLRFIADQKGIAISSASYRQFIDMCR